jgi:hypothetical protein
MVYNFILKIIVMLSFGLEEEGGYKVLLSQREGFYHRGREGFSQRRGGFITEGGRGFRRGWEVLSQREGGVSQRNGGSLGLGGVRITGWQELGG